VHGLSAHLDCRRPPLGLSSSRRAEQPPSLGRATNSVQYAEQEQSMQRRITAAVSRHSPTTNGGNGKQALAAGNYYLAIYYL